VFCGSHGRLRKASLSHSTTVSQPFSTSLAAERVFLNRKETMSAGVGARPFFAASKESPRAAWGSIRLNVGIAEIGRQPAKKNMLRQARSSSRFRRIWLARIVRGGSCSRPGQGTPGCKRRIDLTERQRRSAPAAAPINPQAFGDDRIGQGPDLEAGEDLPGVFSPAFLRPARWRGAAQKIIGPGNHPDMFAPFNRRVLDRFGRRRRRMPWSLFADSS